MILHLLLIPQIHRLISLMCSRLIKSLERPTKMTITSKDNAVDGRKSEPLTPLPHTRLCNSTALQSSCNRAGSGKASGYSGISAGTVGAAPHKWHSSSSTRNPISPSPESALTLPSFSFERDCSCWLVASRSADGPSLIPGRLLAPLAPAPRSPLFLISPSPLAPHSAAPPRHSTTSAPARPPRPSPLAP